MVPALTVLTLLTILVNTDLHLSCGNNMSDWCSVSGSSVGAWCLDGSALGGSLDVAASGCLAAIVLLGDNTSVTGWASDLTELETLGGVALTEVLEATFLSIDILALQVLVALASWLLDLWADNELTTVAVLVWCAANS